MTFRYDQATGRAKLVVYAGLDHNGRQRQRAKTWRSPNERQARREAAKHEATIRDDIERNVERSKTVAGLTDAWQAHRDAEDSPTTARGRAAALERIRRDIGHHRIEALTARHLDEWFALMRARGLTPTTIHNHYVLVRAIVRQGWKWGDCTAATLDVVARSSPPSGRTRKPAPPTSAALAVLIGSAPPDLQLCARLAASTGMRRGEILGLRWGDIDWTASSVTVERAYVYVGKGRGHVYKATKTDEPRVIAIGPGLLERLQMRRWIADGTGAVIPDLAADPSGHTPRPVSWLSQAWAKHCRRHGSTARFHDLRHWHATVLLDEGTALATVQGRLGHSKATTTLNIYTHAVAASDIAAAALAEGLLELTTSTGEHHE